MLKEEALKYMGHRGQELTPIMEQALDECILEVKQYGNFKAVTKQFSLSHSPLKIDELEIELDYEDIKTYFEGCTSCIVIACTLGIGLERRIKYWSKVNMSRSVMMDAVASAYLEECCDQYEATLDLKERTYRFAPGYGDLPLGLNIPLGNALNISKVIGVSRTRSGLFLPQKSMLGLIGIGTENLKRSCGNCIRREQCELRKEGLRCYKTD
ncbi:MAG: Vitamin B12 dependent methionine synthase, activation domain protein [Anaerostipes sp.]|nr:Vitamin B12 dependent methionine synthase, activation domain protein [Anaerostipes sp.]